MRLVTEAYSEFIALLSRQITGYLFTDEQIKSIT